MAASDREIVLITGANTGLGLELAKQLLANHGDRFHVLVGARTAEKGEQAVRDLHTRGLTASEAVLVDVTSDESIAQAANGVEQKFGRLDVLHVNAGVAPDRDYLKDPSSGSISSYIMDTMRVNVAGAAQTAVTFAPLLQKAANPRVVFISSMLGSVSTFTSQPTRIWPAYSPSKSALNMFMLWYAAQWPQFRVNATNPGYRATQLNDFGEASKFHKPGSVADGVRNAVRLSLLEKDGETATFTMTVDGTDEVRTIPW